VWGLLVLIVAAGVGLPTVLSYRQTVTDRESRSELKDSLREMEHQLLQLQSELVRKRAAPREPEEGFTEFRQLLELANDKFQRGEFDEARKLYRRAIQADLDGRYCDEARYRLGLCLGKLGEPEAALREFQTVFARYPGSAYYGRAGLEMAKLLHQEKQFARERRVLYQIVGLQNRLRNSEPESVEEAYFALGASYESEADMIEAAHPFAAIRSDME
jgi:tetratricopeptide (TPR) repeat protein